MRAPGAAGTTGRHAWPETVTTMHGYRVTRLPGPLPWVQDAADGDAPANEVLIGVGADRHVPDGPPPGEILAHLEDPGRTTFYTFGAAAGRTVLRFQGAVDFDADPGLRRLEAHLAPGFDPGIVDVLVGGTLLAARMIMDGRLVLHASAVEVPGEVFGRPGPAALAFVGAPGMGKSTLAGLGAAAGFPLVTDDVLRCDVEPGAAAGSPVTVWPGAVEVRLREGSFELAERAAPDRVRRTADDRVALRAASSARSALPLGAVVIPSPDRGIAAVRIERLDPMAAVRAIGAFPRILGWRHRPTLLEQFHRTVDLCSQVPVYVADLPWGPPFRVSVIDELLALLSRPAP